MNAPTIERVKQAIHSAFCASVAANRVAAGFTTIKVKVGGEPDADQTESLGWQGRAGLPAHHGGRGHA